VYLFSKPSVQKLRFLIIFSSTKQLCPKYYPKGKGQQSLMLSPGWSFVNLASQMPCVHVLRSQMKVTYCCRVCRLVSWCNFLSCQTTCFCIFIFFCNDFFASDVALMLKNCSSCFVCINSVYNRQQLGGKLAATSTNSSFCMKDGAL